jgi:hypothetical protein
LNPDTPEIEDIFQRKFDDMDYEETMRKVAILTHIYSREI